VHARCAPDGRLVDPAVHLSLLAEDGVDLGSVDRRLRGIDLCLGHFSGATGRLVDLREDLADGRCERLFVTHAADVHEHHLRRIPEEVVVQRGHLEPAVERDGYDGVDLVLGQDEVAHDHGVLRRPPEGGPGGEAHRRRDLHSRRRDAEIRARHRDLEDTLLRVEGPVRARQLLDLLPVQLRLR
jgi:hypothetical protein